ncbi:hypothetical protein J4G33_14985 [Actinotalea sp. BY-33]|uniref:DUF3137 domain-containing protein n=1 Tax=Actinotalea soli TaxID=2819234 RepID=A0A939RUW8_9CELL|nr:hypothetical protein [Actinotalea soli]MBO1753114.1 hypothetical protein [Actinotalea soli]
MVDVVFGVLSFLVPLAMVLIVPAVLLGGLWWHFRGIKKTKEWAAQVGWQYVGSDPSLVSRWRGQPFGQGSGRQATRVVTGTYQGRQAVSFAYRYTTGSGKNRSTTTFHVLALHLPAYLPTLELTPEGVGARLAKVFGAQDIQFESEAFNRAWRIAAPDERFAHDVLSPRLMERLLRPDALGLALRIEGQDVLCWSLGAPQHHLVARRLGVMSAIVEAVPRFVWQDHGYDPLNR